MALKTSLKLLAVIVSVAATQVAVQRDILIGFFDYCDQTSLQWYPQDQRAIIADCSTSNDPVYYESRLDLNNCFGNNDGAMIFQVDGNAFDSCICDMGEQIDSCRPNCQSTQLQCACEDINGGNWVNSLDLNDYIGLGYDGEGRVVMQCYSSETGTVAKGTFLECIMNGYTTDCK